MNRTRARELLPIIQAFAEGKTVQYRNSDKCLWNECNEDFGIGFHSDMEYRIKPEPREFWIYPIGSTGAILDKFEGYNYPEATEGKMGVIKVREVLDDENSIK